MIFDFVNVIQEECTLGQALITSRQMSNLSLLAASQTKDKEALTEEGVQRVIHELVDQMKFDYVLCDSPAGIESGARHAMYLADEAIIVTNPELSSCRDSGESLSPFDRPLPPPLRYPILTLALSLCRQDGGLHREQVQAI